MLRQRSVRVVFCLSLLCAGLSLAAPVPAADSTAAGDGSGIFDFSDLDVPGAGPAEEESPGGPKGEPDDPIPEAVREVLDKWERFHKVKKRERHTRVKTLRETAAESLLRRAASMAAGGNELTETAKRLTSLDPDAAVSTASAATAPERGGLVDAWTGKDGKHTWIYTKEGKMLGSHASVVWSWVDQKNKIALSIWDGEYPEIIRVLGDRYEAKNLYNAPTQCFRVKSGGLPAAGGAAAAVLTKLAADEKVLSAAEEKLFAEKRARICAFLRARARKADGPALAALMEKSAAFDDTAAASAKPGAGAPGSKTLAGPWLWPGNKKAAFHPNGGVTVEGFGTGVWKSANKAHTAFAVVIKDNIGRVANANQILLARVSTKDPSILRVVDISGKRFDVRKSAKP